MNKINEKRKQARVDINWPIDVFLDGRKIEGEAKNITPKGLFVCCEEALNLKENFHMSIFPPNHQAVNVVGKAIWSDFYAIDNENTPVCVGMSFVEISAKDRHVLKKMIQNPIVE